MIEAETARWASFYVGPSAVATSSTNANVTGPYRGPVHTAQVLEKVRGTGRVIPSVFKPIPSTASPTELFPPTSSVSYRQSPRFISRDDQTKGFIFTDGGCPNNGQSEPRAGWAIVWGSTNVNIVADRLESKGPFSHTYIQTSNRAKLRAVIAALRIRDWRNDGFTSLVIATDSTYVTAAQQTRSEASFAIAI